MAVVWKLPNYSDYIIERNIIIKSMEVMGIEPPQCTAVHGKAIGFE